ncbi:MAG: MFS transporter [Planctomycetota bacterium]
MTHRPPNRIGSQLRRAVPVRDDEVAATLWGFACLFCLMSGYYVLRPLRDALGYGRASALPWLFLGTFLTMLAAVPLYGALVARLPRRVFIPVCYRLFAVILVLFWLARLALRGAADQLAINAFFVSVSVLNLFVVSVFWSHLADLLAPDQAKRLFAFIASGASLGALAGSAVTSLLVLRLGTTHMLLLPAVLFEVAVRCAQRVDRAVMIAARTSGARATATAASVRGEPTGGDLLAGVRLVLRSRYLQGICLYLFFSTLNATIVYFEQGRIVKAAYPDEAARTEVLANVNLAVQLLAMLAQALLTARLLQWIGVGGTLTILPAAHFLGSLALGAAPVLVVMLGYEVVRRALSYGVATPAKEVLFTVVDRETKYKSKNFIDTVVFRGGDVVAGWLFDSLANMGLGLATISFLAAPIGLLWSVNAWQLGRRQQQLAALVPAAPPAPSAERAGS